jgi:hypothetical protein
VIISEQVGGFQQRLAETWKRWWPALLVWLGNAAWLAYFYTLGAYGSYQVEVVNEPLTGIGFLSALAEAWWKAGFYVWAQVLALTADAIGSPTSLLTLTVIGFNFIFFIFYFGRVNLPGTGPGMFALSALLILTGS